MNGPVPIETEAYEQQALEQGRMYEGVESARHWSRLRLCQALIGAHRSRGLGPILDIGGGDGFAAGVVIGSAPYESYVCVDLAATKAAAATRRFDVARGVAGGATSLPLRNGAFDVVLCMEVLEHLMEPDEAVAEIRRVLRPDGICIIAVPVNSRAWRWVLDTWHVVKRRLGIPQKPVEHVQTFRKKDVLRLMEEGGLLTIDCRLGVFSVPLLGPADVRTKRGELTERILRGIPLDDFGFVRGRWILSVGRQHLVLVATRLRGQELRPPEVSGRET